VAGGATRVLDTTAVSALMKGEPAAVDRLAALGRRAALLPQAVVSEVAYGLARLSRSKRRSRLEARFALVLSELPRAEWTDDVSWRFGSLKAELERRGERLEDLDVAVAAHAVAYEAVLVTENPRHMERVPGLSLESWS